MSKFFKSLQNVVNEKDVENIYREEIKKQLSVEIDSRYGTDGYCEVDIIFDDDYKKLMLIMEFKFDVDFSNKMNIAKVLIQVIYYLKKFADNANPLPNVALIGDQNEAFVLSTQFLQKYLNEDVDWYLAPSEASKHNRDMVFKIYEDTSINPFVFKIDENFKFEQLVEKLKGIVTDINYQIKITEENITIAYMSFILSVIVNYEKIPPNNLVSIFIGTILNSDSVYLHPNSKKNCIVWNDNETNTSYEYKINHESYKAFVENFRRNYSPSEKRKFTEIADRLIEDTNRRLKGEYYTPSNFVKYSHNVIAKHLGDNWAKDFFVWDCAWGTGNLTRDLSFENLFASTLNESDLTMGANYNKASHKFVYDFLNDDPDLLDASAMLLEETKLPTRLVQAFQRENENILFYINPPYATGGNANAKERKSKKDLARNAVGELMRENNLQVSEQLYAQFLYRIIKFKEVYNLNNVYIGIFCPSLFLTGTKFKKFRELFLTHFEYVEGNIFKASHFADVKDSWAIDFSFWKPIRTFDVKNADLNTIPTTFKHNVLDINMFGEVQVIGEKVLWNLDKDITLQDWLTSKSEQGLKADKALPVFTSAFKCNNQLKLVSKKSLGFFVNDTNNIEAVAKGCYFMPSKITRNIRTVTMTHENFIECCVTFAARNIQTANWINQKNEFSAPNELHPNYKTFQVLSLVYSIFSPSNNNISYRQLEVEGESYHWNNEFFFLSNQFMSNLADENYNEDVYEDALQFSGERFAYKYLEENKALLSDSCKEILAYAKKLIVTSFKFRKTIEPEYHLNTWDASWTQIRRLLKMNQFELELNTMETYLKTLKRDLLELSKDLVFLKYD